MSARKGTLAAALILALGLAQPASAAGERTVLVFRNGRSMEVKGWETRGALTHITGLDGSVNVVRTESLDFEKSRRATEAARRPPTPTPTPTPKKGIVELSREIQERRRRAGTNAPEPGIPEVLPLSGARTPAPVRSATPPPTTRTPSSAATPAPTQVAAVVTPRPEPTAAEAEAEATPGTTTPAASSGRSSILVLAAVGMGLLVVAAGAVVVVRRRRPPEPARKPQKPAPGEELLRPAFSAEEASTDLPIPVPMGEDGIGSPAELRGSGIETKALPPASVALPPPPPPPQAVLEDGHELQIRIQADVYTCPDLATLKRWVEEGRVIETSEVLGSDGTWLLAGSIPDLEQAFDRRRETLGY